MFGIPNPWLILGALLAVIALTIGAYTKGHSDGADGQARTDQKEFDRINEERSAQKAEANKQLQKAQADIIALQLERDQFKTEKEQEHAKNVDLTDKLRRSYAGVGLQFRAAQNPGCGPGGIGAKSPSGDPAGIAGSAVVQLPDAVAADLRQLTFEADQLADEYKLCHAWVKGAK